MSLEDDIARQAFHVEQFDQQKQYLFNCLQDMTLHPSRRSMLTISYREALQNSAEAHRELKRLTLLLPLSLPPDPRWGR